MIEKVITKSITLTKDNVKVLKKIEACFLVASNLYEGLQEMPIEITDSEKLTAFNDADKPTRRTLLEVEVKASYDEWVKQYAVDRIETYTGEEELQKVIGNDVIIK